MTNIASLFPFQARPLALSAIVLCAGCAGPNMALQEAQQAYRQAEQDPQVTSHAPVALHEAAQALSKAEQASNQEEIEHMAYITKKRVEIARAEAERKLAEANAKQLLEGRDKVIAQQAKARAQKLEQELAELKAKRTDRGFVITLGDVLFEYNQARLKPGAQQNLYQLVSFLKQHPEQKVLIEGHTDSTGSESYNLGLSQRRAQAVQDFLVMNGISPERINARGYGEAYPVASNNTGAGRQQNRRVEVVFVGEGQRPALSGRGEGSAAP